ncbi:MAG: M6 family metalloprotease domain-containing protein [Prevotella sp.]|nr:M6 family metalloprotease domain-containing protein [Prevotella sp.]
MKRLLLTLLTIAVCAQMQAIPSQRNLAKVKQPDGTELTIRLVGDEFLNFNVTEDGFSVVRDERGFYVYAEQNAEGELVPTTQIAHDEPLRQSKEKAFLAKSRKYLQPRMTERISRMQREEKAMRQKAAEKHRAPNYDYTNFRGLVVLVEFNDRSFDTDNYKDVVTNMITQENFTGYRDYNNRNVACTGSVLDYFRDNSMGIFMPQFDIVGPVQINRSEFYSNGTKNTVQMTIDACNAIDADVNFADYDGDKDGYVDMVYFIFAGHGSHVTGNDSRLVWPHAYYIFNPSTYYRIRKDGVYLDRYACSTELYGSTNNRTIDGIGTICHEFSHVLGLLDFYDTDYAESGGQSNDPSSWTLMAQGAYLNSSRTPAGYSLFERYMVGFATPQVINEEGSYTLEQVNQSNTGYRINTPVNKEYFILENRQKTRWDTYLPGHGLLVFRVDSTNTTVWSNNQINANPKHNYYELVRARGTGAAAASDPFPGNGRVTKLNNVTTPANLKTWAGKETKFGLLNIKEQNGVITFDIENTYVLRELTLPETFEIGLNISQKLTATVEPEYATYKLTWKSDDETIAKVDQEGTVTGVGIGETTVTVESDNGLSASCKVTVIKMSETNQIAEFKTFEEDKEAILNLENAQVLYVFQNDVYIRDASGAIVLNKVGINVKRNDIVSGKFIGKLQHTNKMPQFVATQDINNLTVSEGQEALPKVVSVTELSEKYYADLVLVEASALMRADKFIWAVDNDGNLIARIFKTFSDVGTISVPSDLTDKRFDILAIFGTHLVSGTIYDELYLLKSPEEIDFSGIELNEIRNTDNQPVYDLQGRKILSTALPKGIYIVGGRKVVVP